jgi:CubicO group peptidase (beta-lactamase class C family)
MLRTIKSLCSIVVNLFYYFFLSLKEKNNLPFTAYRYSAFSIIVVLLFIHTSCNNNKSHAAVLIRADTTAYIQIADPTPISAAEKARIFQSSEEWYNRMLRATRFNGGMIVAKKGNIIFERYNGNAHIFGKDTINANTSLHVASISKTFTAMAVVKLWQDGKLNLDDQFSKYFPQFNYPGVTIRTLLCHRSGLPNYLYFMADLGWDQSKFVRNENVLTTLIDRKSELKFTPANTHFEYCNTNYALLGLLLEKITGKKLPEFLKETFFVPLQMKNTFIYTDADSAKTTPSYDWRNKMYPFAFLDKVYGDKNVFTTPRDLLIWDRALSIGKIFKPEVLEEAYKPYSNERRGIKNYGLGWHMFIYPKGPKVIYHNGWWHGSNAVFIRLLQDSATIIVIGNKFNHNIYKAKDLTDIFGIKSTDADDEPENSNERGNKSSN